MKKGEIRVFLVIISLVLSLAVLWIGFNLYTKYLLEAPLIKELEKKQEIKKVEIKKGKTYQVVVELKKVANLMETYADICTVLDDKIGEKKYVLLIEDNPDQKLQEVYYELQPAIYEAIDKGAYTWLQSYLDEKLAEMDLNYDMFVDEKYIYLQIMQDRDYYLYAIISRRNEV